MIPPPGADLSLTDQARVRLTQIVAALAADGVPTQAIMDDVRDGLALAPALARVHARRHPKEPSSP